jgi:hypothetical protein
MKELRAWLDAAYSAREFCENLIEFDALIAVQEARYQEMVREP